MSEQEDRLLKQQEKMTGELNELREEVARLREVEQRREQEELLRREQPLLQKLVEEFDRRLAQQEILAQLGAIKEAFQGLHSATQIGEQTAAKERVSSRLECLTGWHQMIADFQEAANSFQMVELSSERAQQVAVLLARIDALVESGRAVLYCIDGQAFVSLSSGAFASARVAIDSAVVQAEQGVRIEAHRPSPEVANALLYLGHLRNDAHGWIKVLANLPATTLVSTTRQEVLDLDSAAEASQLKWKQAPLYRTSRTAVISLLLGFTVALCLPVIGAASSIGFGTAALIAMRRQPARGKAAAILGIVLGVIGLILWIALFIASPGK
jgi:hypothetical protein